VMHVLYLVFNEGYASTSGESLARTDLSSEAIRLTRMLHHALPDHADVLGLLALMLLTDARRDARTGPAGELVPLDEQDRTRWNADAIAEGVFLVSRAFQVGGPLGPYPVEAAIAALHDEAPSAEVTDWPKIVALYELRMRMSDNPVVALNHAVALAMVEGPAAGLARVDVLASDPRLATSHRVDAVRGHLLERLGDRDAAVAAYARAAERATNLAERSYLLVRTARVRET
jgi:predicted RNA polymerase sigma factor